MSKICHFNYGNFHSPSQYGWSIDCINNPVKDHENGGKFTICHCEPRKRSGTHVGRKSCYWDFYRASLVVVLLEFPAKETAFDVMQVGGWTLNRRNSAVFQIIITFYFIVFSGAKSTEKGFIVEDLHGIGQIG